MTNHTIFKCQDCGWEGKWFELKTSYIQSPFNLDDVETEIVCPECNSVRVEELEEELIIIK